MIHDAGFTGIVTFSSLGSLGQIPRIAHDEGLAVIAGVWYPQNGEEIQNAINMKPYVLGYSIGQDRLYDMNPPSPEYYSLETLTSAVRYIRAMTSRPVTTTEQANNYDYPDQPRLLPLSDWLFPDVHPSLDAVGRELSHEQIRSAVKDMLESVGKVEALSKRSHRPLMLKMAAFPHAGVPGASPSMQRDFFEILDAQIANKGLRDVTLVPHSAFDSPWKTGGPFQQWDAHTGLISSDGSFMPVIGELVKHGNSR
jgi:exo-beta-1,3-glucanase (GH17 family)